MGIDAEMFVRTRTKIPDDQLREIGRRLCAMFGYDRFSFGRTYAAMNLRFENETEEDLRARHVIYPVATWDQDGPEIVPDPGEFFYKLAIRTRYYGVGYERGDAIFLLALAEALEHLIPPGEVWYGGDSSGVCAAPFNKRERAALREHFFAYDHAPYSRHVNEYMTSDKFDDMAPPRCSLCQHDMQRYGFGNEYASYSCECGERVVMRGGKTERTTPYERRKLKSDIQGRAMDEYFEKRPASREAYNEVCWEG